MADWSPATYLKFEDERTRAARDLLAQINLEAPRKIVDVGCGPGNSTELLAARFPHADIVGLDNSPAMIGAARRRAPNLRFEAADANMWTPEPDIDLVFANATYQWVADHLEQLGRVLKALAPGAVLAVQMPDNLAEATHSLMKAVAEDGPWAARLRDAARDRLPPPRAYYDALTPHAQAIDIWHTIYNHVLADAGAVVDFVRGTGLRPFIDPLTEAEREAFLSAYQAAIVAAYPPAANGKVLLRFPRLFIVARR
ncbi:MAG: trans-aconitate 2-methyltransferase [Caulobacteraceae bacterium]